VRENLIRTITFTFAREGSVITNDPVDKGGLTAAYGLTLKTMKNLGLDLDRDGDVDSHDVKLVDKAIVEDVFITKFWSRIRGDVLPGGVDLIMADIAWMSGPGRANQFWREGHRSIESLTTRRKNHFDNIVERDPSQKRFINGWKARADMARVEAYKCVGAK